MNDRLDGAIRQGDDPADGWFPESVAADYDAPGGESPARRGSLSCIRTQSAGAGDSNPGASA